MKNLNSLFVALLFVVSGCTDGYIDEIQQVAPGADEAAPVVSITYPLEGTLIRVVEDVTPINIQFTVSDDVEIQGITVQLDGSEIASFNEFVDFRKAIKEFTYNELTNGAHTLTVVATDLSGKSTTESVDFEKVEPYRPIYDGEIFYMPFDGDNTELVTITTATRVGDPGFNSNGREGSAYAGANGAYLTLPTTGLTNPEFSAVFWYKIDATPDRAGIITVSPPGADNNNRTSGFRFFREGNATNQTFKLNVGNGAGETWVDGGAAASINPANTTGWVHLAFTISSTTAVVYINGEEVKESVLTGLSWADCDILSIGSGAPNFTGWNHLSDLSLIDELRIFDKALTPAEIQAIIDAES